MQIRVMSIRIQLRSSALLSCVIAFSSLTSDSWMCVCTIWGPILSLYTSVVQLVIRVISFSVCVSELTAEHMVLSL